MVTAASSGGCLNATVCDIAVGAGASLSSRFFVALSTTTEAGCRFSRTLIMQHFPNSNDNTSCFSIEYFLYSNIDWALGVPSDQRLVSEPMINEDLEKQLAALSEQRANLEQSLKESLEVLQSVDEKIADFKRRQQLRLISDDRVDNAIAKKVSDEHSLPTDVQSNRLN